MIYRLNGWPLRADCRMTAMETGVVKSRHSFRADQLVLFPPFRSHGFVRIVPESGMHFASLGRAFQADGRGFSPIEGGLEGGGSVA
jgi:hypothetical protein